MPLQRYGVLKGRPIRRRAGSPQNPHYQVQVIDNEVDYRIAINVRSQETPSELEYFIADEFQHPITAGLLDLSKGFTPLESKLGTLALDFIRANLFHPNQMRLLPFRRADSDNELDDLLDRYVAQAINDEEAIVYAFGSRWGPERDKDKIFGFSPGNGIHDIHMNQGNTPSFVRDDGVWQDGALVLHLPSENRWVGIFLKFQSQTWHTDDQTGHRLEEVALPVAHEEGAVPILIPPDLIMRIVAAVVNPVGPAPEKETIVLLNTSPQAIDLQGWCIADRLKQKQVLSGTIEAGSPLKMDVKPPVQLGNKGGIITLLNAQGIKVHGVSFTQEQAQREGWAIVF
jgi:uncharacterized protein YukJ